MQHSFSPYIDWICLFELFLSKTDKKKHITFFSPFFSPSMHHTHGRKHFCATICGLVERRAVGYVNKCEKEEEEEEEKDNKKKNCRLPENSEELIRGEKSH